MFKNFPRGIMPALAKTLLNQPLVHVGEWQSTDVSGSKLHSTYEAVDVSLKLYIPDDVESLANYLGEDLNREWAEEHFQERVGGVPLNPPPSHVRWPWARHNTNHQDDGEQFSHTYPERMWPKVAGREFNLDQGRNVGIRFLYGDLSDVVDLLVRSPLTRQAYLPIWFPEDTGTVHGKRVPCTLGYHFMIRDNLLSCRYYMRSCDLIRHFTDDIYLAARLMQWVCEKVNVGWCPYYGDPEAKAVCEHEHLETGNLVMHIASLHAFKGDEYKLRQIASRPVEYGQSS